MAFEVTDLLVVQKQTGASEIRKATVQQLSDFLQTSNTVEYKGLADFTVAGEEPQFPAAGDLYINSAAADGSWAWSANSGGVVTVSPSDRALYNGTTWDIIGAASGGGGVELLSGTLPIEVGGTAALPVVSVKEATVTTSGVVARYAVASDLRLDGTGSNTAAVTADLMGAFVPKDFASLPEA